MPTRGVSAWDVSEPRKVAINPSTQGDVSAITCHWGQDSRQRDQITCELSNAYILRIATVCVNMNRTLWQCADERAEEIGNRPSRSALDRLYRVPEVTRHRCDAEIAVAQQQIGVK